MDVPLVIAVTQGDDGGIGPEVLIKALSKLVPRLKNVKFVLLGNANIHKLRRRLRIRLHERRVREKDLPSVVYRWKTAVFVLKETSDDLEKNLITATKLIKKRVASALVTMPAKKLLRGAKVVGHTELLSSITGAESTGMLFFYKDRLRIMPLTLHIPLRDVASFISIDKIVEAAKLLDRHLRTDFNIPSPTIGVAALNPHRGENGTVGEEEQEVIAPAVHQLQQQNIKCIGPYNAYELVSQMMRGELDAIIATHHDQAITPLKILFGNRGVNMTLGLPFVRTSPLHGTADGIAGSNLADPQGAIDALLAAIRIAERRRKFSKGGE